MDFDLFPLKLKYQILSFLTDQELYEKVPQVSKHWKDISRSPHLKKQIAIIGDLGYKTSTHDISKLFTIFGHNCRKIRKLYHTYKRVRSLSLCSFNRWNWVNDVVDQVCLRELKLSSSSFESKELLFLLLKKFPKLESLTLSRLDFANNDCMDLPIQCKFLKFISLEVDHKEEDHSCHCLDFVTENCENLEELRFSSKSEIAETSVVKFRERPMRSLKKMTLRSNQIIQPECQLFVWHNQLTHLDIHINTQGSHANPLMSIRNLMQLQSLTVTTTGYLLEWCNLLGLFVDITFPSLKEIHFSGCSFLTDSVVDVMIESCPALESLRLVDLIECRVSESKANEIRYKFNAQILPSDRHVVTEHCHLLCQSGRSNYEFYTF